ncbi:isochorismatase family cysteine hydrolase [Stenotrophomonas sp.]|uniref:cysteine hydrolase family protein n=2 Tax=unclassified Stenotrophomonas TaxID=196198 RepID=UPI00333F9ACE
MNIASLIGLAGILGVATASAQPAAEPAHPTIRHMAGAPTAAALPVGKTALLVIDFQNEYFAGGRMPIPDGDAALAQTRRLVTFADAHKIPVIHVQHVLPAGAPLFAEGGRTVQFHPRMQPRKGEQVIAKDTVSVFAGTSGPVLEQALKEAGIDTLIIAGLQTHACVAGAARDAAPKGLNVIVSSDATASRDLELHDGSQVGHASLHAAALASIEDTFGSVLSTDQILALPVR